MLVRKLLYTRYFASNSHKVITNYYFKDVENLAPHVIGKFDESGTLFRVKKL